MYTGRRLPLPINLQHTLWACGLRGAVAYGLAVNLPNIDAESDEGIPAIESATLVIVLVSTLLFGGVTGGTFSRQIQKLCPRFSCVHPVDWQHWRVTCHHDCML